MEYDMHVFRKVHVEWNNVSCVDIHVIRYLSCDACMSFVSYLYEFAQVCEGPDAAGQGLQTSCEVCQQCT